MKQQFPAQLLRKSEPTSLALVCGALFCLLAAEAISSAQEGLKQDTAKTTLPIQQQIDALKQGQEQILQELAEIKKLLQEKPNRIDYPAKPTPPTVISLNVHGELFRGDSQASVAIIEYSDFDCSFCAKYIHDVYPSVAKEYIQTGKVKYFFRDMPGVGETNALVKARAARCAGEQGKFWEMHDRLFASQNDPAGQSMEAQAQAIGANLEKFNACLASGRYTENIRLSVEGARRAGLYGTPAFLIGKVSGNGDFVLATKVLVGGDSFETIRTIVEELLAAPSTK